MESIKRSLSAARRHPVKSIGVILAIGLAVFAIYFMGPWYVTTASGSIGAVFDTQIARTVVGALYLFPCVTYLTALVKGNLLWQRIGSFGLATGFAFTTILRLVTFGFFPVLWIFQLLCALVAGVVYLYISLNGHDE